MSTAPETTAEPRAGLFAQLAGLPRAFWMLNVMEML